MEKSLGDDPRKAQMSSNTQERLRGGYLRTSRTIHSTGNSGRPHQNLNSVEDKNRLLNQGERCKSSLSYHEAQGRKYEQYMLQNKRLDKESRNGEFKGDQRLNSIVKTIDICLNSKLNIITVNKIEQESKRTNSMTPISTTLTLSTSRKRIKRRQEVQQYYNQQQQQLQQLQQQQQQQFQLQQNQQDWIDSLNNRLEGHKIQQNSNCQQQQQQYHYQQQQQQKQSQSFYEQNKVYSNLLKFNETKSDLFIPYHQIEARARNNSQTMNLDGKMHSKDSQKSLSRCAEDNPRPYLRSPVRNLSNNNYESNVEQILRAQQRERMCKLETTTHKMKEWVNGGSQQYEISDLKSKKNQQYKEFQRQFEIQRQKQLFPKQDLIAVTPQIQDNSRINIFPSWHNSNSTKKVSPLKIRQKEQIEDIEWTEIIRNKARNAAIKTLEITKMLQEQVQITPNESRKGSVNEEFIRKERRYKRHKNFKKILPITNIVETILYEDDLKYTQQYSANLDSINKSCLNNSTHSPPFCNNSQSTSLNKDLSKTNLEISNSDQRIDLSLSLEDKEEEQEVSLNQINTIQRNASVLENNNQISTIHSATNEQNQYFILNGKPYQKQIRMKSAEKRQIQKCQLDNINSLSQGKEGSSSSILKIKKWNMEDENESFQDGAKLKKLRNTYSTFIRENVHCLEKIDKTQKQEHQKLLQTLQGRSIFMQNIPRQQPEYRIEPWEAEHAEKEKEDEEDLCFLARRMSRTLHNRS